MSDDFKPGDFVECVDNSPRIDPRVFDIQRAARHAELLTVGELYTVRELITGYDVLGVLLHEVRGSPVTAGWAAFRFRKIHRPDPKLIERLTAEPVFAPPVSRPVREDA